MVGDLISIYFLGVVATIGNSSFFFFASSDNFFYAWNDNVKIVPYDTPVFDVLLTIFQSNLQLGQVIVHGPEYVSRYTIQAYSIGR